MKSGLRAVLIMAGLALCLACGAVATAQNREKYVISAKAGGINLVAGDVTVRRAGSQGERRLTAKDSLESGDVVTTGAGGRVEVLLNPGSYMRVSEGAEFELTDTSLDSLEVNLHRGNAIVEVASAYDVKVEINITTPQSSVTITKGGIYRFNVLPNEATEIFVRKGKLVFGKGKEDKLKGGQKVVIRQGRTEVAKFDKKEQDALDLWSRDRAKTLAKANEQLQARSLIAAFRGLNSWDSMNVFSASYSGWGAWVYNPRASSYCFFPLGGRGWSSPYGHSYTNGGGWTGGGVPIYPTTGGATGSGGGNGGGNPSSPSSPSSPTPAPSSPAPMPSSPPPMAPMPSAPMREMPSEPAPRREYTREP